MLNDEELAAAKKEALSDPWLQPEQRKYIEWLFDQPKISFGELVELASAARGGEAK